jgi:hypothetical protein
MPAGHECLDQTEFWTESGGGVATTTDAPTSRREIGAVRPQERGTRLNAPALVKCHVTLWLETRRGHRARQADP